MKNGLIYLAIFLLGVNVVFAGIDIDRLDRYEYNLGEKVDIGGDILFDEAIFGALEISLNCENSSTPVYYALVDIKAGEVFPFGYDVPTRENFTGNCKLVLNVYRDNDKYEKESEAFKISNELKVDVVTNVLVVKPGEEVIISGNARKLNGEVITNGDVVLTIDDNTKNFVLGDDTFEYILTLISDIKSGKHNVALSITDLFGNKGEDKTSFRVMSVPRKVELDVGSSYKPGDFAQGTVRLYDQAGDLINTETVVMEVYNPLNNFDQTKTFAINEPFNFELEEFAMPGEWKIKVMTGGLVAEKTFNVEEVKSKEIWLEGKTLFVRNTGNVDYNDPIEINLEGVSDVGLIKTTSLKPNQTVMINLDKEVDYTGEYNVNVKDYPAITGNVVLVGKKSFRSAILGWAALTFVAIFIIAMSLRVSRKVAKKKRLKELEERDVTVLARKEDFRESETKKEDIKYLINKVKKENPIKTDEKRSSSDRSMFRIFDN